MMQLFEQVGLLAWPLAISSVLALAIILEKFWVLRRARVLSSSSKTSILTNLIQSIQHCQNKSEVEQIGQHIVLSLERHLNLLGIIATIAPLLGLLGTVLGMMEVFDQLMQMHSVQTERLAGGISQALLTTAVGLIIAIPSYICHKIFQRRIEVFSQQLEQAAATAWQGKVHAV